MVLWKKILGIVLVVVGVSGLVLPFVPGIALIIIGLVLMGNHKLVDWAKEKFKSWKK